VPIELRLVDDEYGFLALFLLERPTCCNFSPPSIVIRSSFSDWSSETQSDGLCPSGSD